MIWKGETRLFKALRGDLSMKENKYTITRAISVIKHGRNTWKHELRWVHKGVSYKRIFNLKKFVKKYPVRWKLKHVKF